MDGGWALVHSCAAPGCLLSAVVGVSGGGGARGSSTFAGRLIRAAGFLVGWRWFFQSACWGFVHLSRFVEISILFCLLRPMCFIYMYMFLPTYFEVFQFYFFSVDPVGNKDVFIA